MQIFRPPKKNFIFGFFGRKGYNPPDMLDFFVALSGCPCSSILGGLLADLRQGAANFWQVSVSLADYLDAKIGEKCGGPDGSNCGGFLNILGMVGIALLTILIPIAVAIFGEKAPGAKYKILDRNVIRDYVVRAKWLLLWLLGFLYAPLLFWGYPLYFGGHYFRYLPYLLLWGIGVFGVLYIFSGIYRWIGGKQFEARKKYLQKLRASGNPEVVEESWRSVWEAKKANLSDEKEFFGIFRETVENLLKCDIDALSKIASGLMEIFKKHVDKRPTNLLVFSKDVLPSILGWHFFAWKNAYGLQVGNAGFLARLKQRVLKILKWPFTVLKTAMRQKKDFVDDVNYNEMCGCLFSIVKKIQARAFGGEHFYPFLTYLHSHIKSVLAQEGEEVRRYVAKELVPVLFPSVCPVMWGRILGFFIQERDVKLAVESPLYFVEAPPSPKGGGAVGVAKEKETLDLALLYYDSYFTEPKLGKYIEKLQEMNYGGADKDSRGMERRRRAYLCIFQKLRDTRAENAGG